MCLFEFKASNNAMRLFQKPSFVLQDSVQLAHGINLLHSEIK